MATATAIEFQFRCLGTAISQFALAASQAAKVFSVLVDSYDPLWATMPGEWPDKFSLLNRYLRTGVKPPFIFNE